MSSKWLTVIVALLALALDARAIDADWAAPETIDFVGDVGRYVSLASNPTTNRPAVSYYSDANLGTLHFAEFDGLAWTSTVITTFVGITEVYTSLAFVGGEPAIAYYDYQRGRLRYATRDAGGAWQIVTVDGNDAGPISQIGADCSLAVLPGGEPAIAYIDRLAGALKYASRSAGIWSKATIPNAASQVGGKCSLAIVGGQPAISFVRNGRLTYAQFDGAAWTVSTALDSSAAPTSTALVSAGGAPAIAYNDAVTGRMLFARHAGGSTALPTNWRRSTVDAAGVSVAVRAQNGPDGVPILAYHRSDAGGGIWLARTTDIVYPLWMRTGVETPSTRGSHLSFAYVAGAPALAYYDSAAGDLLYTTLIADANANGIPDSLEPTGATGACCIGATCAIGSAASCVAAGGVYIGAGAVCAPSPCAGATGACCDGATCLIVTGAACGLVGGTYLGDGATCAGSPCTGPTGACCLDGTCFVATQGICDALSRSYRGDGSVCSPTCVGDMDCDGDVDFIDIEPFILAFQGPAAYNDSVTGFPCCPWLNGDANGDLTVDFFDIDAFIGLLGNICP